MKREAIVKIFPGEMKLAIHQTHNCEPTKHIGSTTVTLLEGSSRIAIEVHLFEVEGHATASECYAWGVQHGDTKISIPAVLRTKEISTPELAIKSLRRSR